MNALLDHTVMARELCPPSDLTAMPEALQRAFGPTEPFANELGEFNMPDLVPLPYRGQRKVNPRSRGSSRFFPVWMDLQAGQPRKYSADSQVEYHHLALTLTNSTTLQVQEQFGPVAYTDFDGKPATHFFDLMITQKDGRKIAVAVKPTERLKSGRFLRDLNALERTMPCSTADEIRLVTELCFCRSDAFNAVLYQRFAICRDTAVEERLRDVLASTIGETTICALAERCRAGGRAFRVIVQGIVEGQLEQLTPGRINLFTRVRRTS